MASLFSQFSPRCAWRPGRSLAGLAAGCLLVALAAAGRLVAQEALPAPAVISTALEFWDKNEAEKRKPQPVRMEILVYYYDAAWSLLYGRVGDVSSYLPVRGRALPIKSGQRVRLEGSVIPAEGFDGALIRVTVLEEHALPEPLPTTGRLGEAAALNGHWVQIEGHVFAQKEPDASHIELTVLAENQLVNLTMQIGGTEPVPQLVGARIRVQGVYDVAPDPAGKIRQIGLWTAEPGRLEVLERLAADERFKLPRTAIDRLEAAAQAPWVRVVGEVRSQEVGTTLTVRDDTGQIVIRTAQPEALPTGATVEVIGKAVPGEVGWTLDDPLFQRMSPDAGAVRGAGPASGQAPLRLRLAEQVLHLPGNEAGKNYPVTLRGVVTWFNERAPYFYLQDASGGVCVRYEPGQREGLAQGASLDISGVTVRGAFVPEVKLTEVKNLGTPALPPARIITLDQALSGAEECLRVEMSGYVRQVGEEAGWIRLDLTGATGEFAAYLPPGASPERLRGAMVRVRGVCATEIDPKREISGIRLWLQGSGAVIIDEPAPQDAFAVPTQTTAGLRQFAVSQAPNQRARVAGMVLLHRPGRYLYLQDAEGGIFVLSRETKALQPGEWVEVAGLPGRAGNRFALREGIWRNIPAGSPIVPREITEARQPVLAADAQLVRLTAVLRQVATEGKQQHLTLEADNVTFDGLMIADAGWTPPKVGSRLALTGVYVVEFDEYRQPHGFHLELRGPADVVVLATPSWWTVRRAGYAVGVLAAFAVLIVTSNMLLRRQVRAQTEQIRRQLEKEARMQTELERSSRLESLAVFAGGIAHDFNNLLTGVLGNLGLAAMDKRVMAAAGDCVSEAERSARRARNIARQLLTFAKGGEPVRASVLLPDVVTEAADFARRGSAVRLEINCPPDLPPADVDAGQISEAVHAIVTNAVQAMPGGGMVTITLAAATLAPGEVDPLPPGAYISLTLADTGPGIPAGDLARIFDPYFPTKPRNADSGLGLAPVRSIIKRHHGHIEVHSRPGEGTTFSIWLPVAREEPPAPVEPLRPAQQGPARILVMDDEAVIRRVAARMLALAGHEIVFAADGAEAIRAWTVARQAGRPFEVVIFDLTVPGGMGGKDAVQELLKLDPGIRAIASSGYSDEPIMANPQAYGFCTSLPKPYDLPDLMKAVEEARRK